MSIRLKFIQTRDVSELEASVNYLLLEGWDKEGKVEILPDGSFFVTMVWWAGRENNQLRIPPQPRLNPLPTRSPRHTMTAREVVRSREVDDDVPEVSDATPMEFSDSPAVEVVDRPYGNTTNTDLN